MELALALVIAVGAGALLKRTGDREPWLTDGVDGGAGDDAGGPELQPHDAGDDAYTFTADGYAVGPDGFRVPARAVAGPRGVAAETAPAALALRPAGAVALGDLSADAAFAEEDDGGGAPTFTVRSGLSMAPSRVDPSAVVVTPSEAAGYHPRAALPVHPDLDGGREDLFAATYGPALREGGGEAAASVPLTRASAADRARVRGPVRGAARAGVAAAAAADRAVGTGPARAPPALGDRRPPTAPPAPHRVVDAPPALPGDTPRQEARSRPQFIHPETGGVLPRGEVLTPERATYVPTRTIASRTRLADAPIPGEVAASGGGGSRRAPTRAGLPRATVAEPALAGPGGVPATASRGVPELARAPLDPRATAPREAAPTARSVAADARETRATFPVAISAVGSEGGEFVGGRAAAAGGYASSRVPPATTLGGVAGGGGAGEWSEPRPAPQTGPAPGGHRVVPRSVAGRPGTTPGADPLGAERAALHATFPLAPANR